VQIVVFHLNVDLVCVLTGTTLVEFILDLMIMIKTNLFQSIVKEMSKYMFHSTNDISILVGIV